MNFNKLIMIQHHLILVEIIFFKSRLNNLTRYSELLTFKKANHILNNKLINY